MILIGVVLLLIAVVTASVGALANSGSDHLITNFSLFGWTLHASTGRLFIYGAIVGGVAMLGLNMLLAGIGRGFKNRVHMRREQKAGRHEVDSLQEDRDRLAHELEEERDARLRAQIEPIVVDMRVDQQDMPQRR